MSTAPELHHGLGDLQSLLTVVRLGDVEVINIHADIFRIDGIQRMLCIDETGDTASLLNLGYHMKRYGCLTTGLRSVDLDHTSLWNTAQSQRNIKA